MMKTYIMVKLTKSVVKRIITVGLILLLVCAAVVGSIVLLHGAHIDVLNPQGEVAMKERNLIVFTLLLSLIVVVPVFTLLIVFSLKYRASNPKKAAYHPNWEGNRLLETIWWGIPCAIILVLGIVTWQSSHALDPYKHLDSNVKALNVQVVALQWKWLFIYPDQHIASVNLLEMPQNTPVNFSITSDAPMNSFWIPSLGGQIYAMSGMSTKLSLVANKTGDFKGSSANISGQGFADMHFTARAVTPADFDTWVHTTQQLTKSLDETSYNELAKPASVKAPLFYKLSDQNLYDTIVMKYMMPAPTNSAPKATTPKPTNMNMNNMDMSHMEGM